MIFGKNVYKYEKEIKKRYGFDSLKQELAFTMPRRAGKSYAAAQVAAAALVSIPGVRIACFAASGRSAGKDSGFMSYVRKHLMKTFGIDKARLETDNKETLELVVDGDSRTFSAYPGAKNALRGVGGNFIIVEEASSIQDDVFFEIVLPLLALDDVCLVCLSTLGSDPCGWFNKLITSNIVESFVVKYVCEACEAKGEILPCIHNIDSLPEHTDSGRMQLMSDLSGEERKETFLREVIGVVNDTNTDRVFSASKIREVVAAPAYEFNAAVREIFVTVDPCAGSEISEKNTSDFAIVAIASPYTVIMGIDALNIVHPDEYRENLFKFLTKLRQHELTKDSVIVLDVEMNTGMTAPDVYAFVTGKFNRVVVINDKTRKEGTLTTEKMKHEMMELTRLLLVKNDVRFWSEFVTNDPNPAAVRAKWATQMTNYRRVFVPGRSVTSKNTYVLSGKGPDKKAMDDLAMTFQRAVRLRYRSENDPKVRGIVYM